MVARIAPFLGFMLFIGLDELLGFFAGRGMISFTPADRMLLYPLRAGAAALLLFWFYKHYDELRWRDLSHFRNTLLSLGTGLLVFVLWINMDWPLPFVGGAPRVGFDPELIAGSGARTALVAVRLAGAVLVVPLMEELFWRSFLLRYLVDNNFLKVEIGYFTIGSCLISALLFGLEHHLFFAGVMAGLFYNLLIYKTKSLAQCVFAHAVTNLALGIYVLTTASWHFW